jgi:hypothetical protein
VAHGNEYGILYSESSVIDHRYSLIHWASIERAGIEFVKTEYLRLEAGEFPPSYSKQGSKFIGLYSLAGLAIFVTSKT